MADITLSEKQLEAIIASATATATASVIESVRDDIIKKSSLDESAKSVARTTFESILASINWYTVNNESLSANHESLLGVLGQGLIEVNRLYNLYTEEEFAQLTGGA
jgi:RNA-binding protein YlmH